jgi:hypothetical protein
VLPALLVLHVACEGRLSQNVSSRSRAAVFIYQRMPERMGVQFNLPIAFFILDFTKGKRLPYSGHIPNAQPPKGVIFIYFLFIFAYVITIRDSILLSSKVFFFFKGFFTFSLVKMLVFTG